MNTVGLGSRAQARAPSLHASRAPSRSSGLMGLYLTAAQATDAARKIGQLIGSFFLIVKENLLQSLFMSG